MGNPKNCTPIVKAKTRPHYSHNKSKPHALSSMHTAPTPCINATAPVNMASIGFESFVPIGSGVRNASFGFRSIHGKDAPATTTTAVCGAKEEAKVCIDVAKTVCKEPSKNAANDHTIKPSYVGSLTDRTASICAGDSCPPETKAALKGKL